MSAWCPLHQPLTPTPVSSLSDRQNESTAGPAARTADIARVPSRRVNRDICCSRSRDHGGSDRDPQLRTADDEGAERRPVDDPDSRRNKLTTIHGEKKALLHLSECNAAGRKRCNGRGGPSTSTCGIERVAGLEEQPGERKRAQKPGDIEGSFHT
jgi:hypothetical protein